MAEGASVRLPFPETAVVACETLEAQSAELAGALPETPIVVGGCCCAHVGAVRGLARRVDRLGLVWLDAHGDLNTPETSPSGNLWGMPFRMILEDGDVRVEDAALVGARNLDPPEVEYMRAAGLDDSVDRALAGADAVYVAFDLDVLDPSAVDVLIPEPGGVATETAESLLRELASRVRIAGMGVSGLLATDRNAATATRLLAAAGF